MIYPNPASNYIVLLHSNEEKIHYQIVSAEGKIMDDFYSYLQDEQIIIPLSNYTSGSYLIKATYHNGRIASKVFIKK
ncbi:MAG: T9SS type A sorting domain-containing protein [Saprospiraceae bacterium]|nr:T9SS type A sorting domain-containing protein [Saprospiraceae bacterium]MBK9721151.1 T9SS type A sorting domain-containing protein [Saprospiraceae bacterium]